MDSTGLKRGRQLLSETNCWFPQRRSFKQKNVEPRGRGGPDSRKEKATKKSRGKGFLR